MPIDLSIVRTALAPDILIDDFLDSGGQGAVFRGRIGRQQVAVKIFEPTATSPRRLERELDALQQIDCPYLVKVLDNKTIRLAGTQFPVVVYEYHSGGDLRRHLATSSPPITVAELFKIGQHIGTAIDELWANRIVHRDVKPGNIVTSRDGRYILVDVGLAKHLNRSDITAVGGAPGTQGYKSPEQAAGRRHLTLASDIFSLGVTLYELATKRHPFGGNQGLIGRNSPLDAARRRPDLPPAFCTLLHEMMAAIPAMRPRKLAEQFEKLLGN